MQKNINLETFDKIKDKILKKEFAIFAMFLNRKKAKAAVKDLVFHGFLKKDIFMLSPDKKGNRDFVYNQNTGIKLGIQVGAIIGFFLMGLVGFIIGAKNPFHLGFSSWIVDLVFGSIFGLIFGAVAGALVGIGTPMPAIKRYGFYLKEGGIVVMVHLKNEEDSVEAHSVLEKAGGQDISVLEESQIWSTINPSNKKFTFH